MDKVYAWVVSGAIVLMMAMVAAGVAVSITISARDLARAENSLCPFINVLLTAPVKPGTPGYQEHISLVVIKEAYKC